MPQMAMYSYKNAHTLRYESGCVYHMCATFMSCRPNDGRFLRALSECYLELNRVDEAKKVHCMYKQPVLGLAKYKIFLFQA